MRGALPVKQRGITHDGIIPADAGSTCPHHIRPGPGRIIPADAGSTIPIHRIRRSGKDHPRGCGEHLSVSVTVSSPVGSSPRMRGARDHGDWPDA